MWIGIAASVTPFSRWINILSSSAEYVFERGS